MAVQQVSSSVPDGSSFGLPGDSISFYGAQPVTQPTNPAQALITDNSGGVANPATGVVAVPAAYNQAELANALATIIAGHNAIVAALVALGLIKGS